MTFFVQTILKTLVGFDEIHQQVLENVITVFLETNFVGVDVFFDSFQDRFGFFLYRLVVFLFFVFLEIQDK